jgi:hypothetical protein
MKGIDPMKFNYRPWIWAIAAAVGGLCLAACAKHSPPVSEAEYSSKIVGSWQGNVGGVNETMSIYRDGTFVCETHPPGFMAKNLFQGAAGTIRGTWKITGSVITLQITGTENEPAKSRIASSTIVAFTEAEIELKANLGESAKFFRVRML